MNLRQFKDLRYYTFETLDRLGVPHGIFTRSGGVSPAPWASLNTGGTLGDSRENVVENRLRIFQAMNRPVNSIFDVWQVHSTDVIYSREPRPLDQAHIKADGIVSDCPEITLMMRFADCVPVILYHPKTGCAALVHAGWKGTLAKITNQAIQVMQTHCQARPSEMIAAIGPSIGPDHYQVGEEVILGAEIAFGKNSAAILHSSNERYYLDLWKANTITLEEAGVQQIEVAGMCTGCSTNEWYSHRVEAGKTGRFGAVLVPYKG
jgi:YfiH family protein